MRARCCCAGGQSCAGALTRNAKCVFYQCAAKRFTARSALNVCVRRGYGPPSRTSGENERAIIAKNTGDERKSILAGYGGGQDNGCNGLQPRRGRASFFGFRW